MKVIKEGMAHRHWAWFTTCNFCGSELRFLDGDPMIEECYNCDSRESWAYYRCPVCEQLGVARSGNTIVPKDMNAARREIILTQEDKEELDSFKNVTNPDAVLFKEARSRDPFDIRKWAGEA